MKLEIEKHKISPADLENVSENGSTTNDSVDPGDRIADSLAGKYPSNGCDDPQGSNGKEVSGNGSNQHGNSDSYADDVSLIMELIIYGFKLPIRVPPPFRVLITVLTLKGFIVTFFLLLSAFL